jgi:hypothetical protein
MKPELTVIEGFWSWAARLLCYHFANCGAQPPEPAND